MNKINDFDGFPLGLGEVFGIRSWRIDQYGRLKSLHIGQAERWRPGLNTAVCNRSGGGYIFGSGFASGITLSMPSYTPYASIDANGNVVYTFGADYGPTSGAITTPPKPKVNLTKKAPHISPVEGCGCGFYAYSSDAHEEVGQNGDISGVIAGSGRVLQGTRGFRCQHAKIVALLNPAAGKKPTSWKHKVMETVRRVYPEVPWADSMRELLEFAPLTSTMPEVGSEDFWALP